MTKKSKLGMKQFGRKALAGAASALALVIAGAAGAEEAQGAMLDIEAQPLAKALLEFNKQTGVIVIANQELLTGKNAPAIKGEMAPDEALAKILSNTGLKSTELPNGAYTITRASAEARGDRTFRVAQVDQEDAEDVEEVPGEREEEEEEERPRDEIVVTGTLIRGIAPDSSPTRTFNREDIQISGAATAQDFIQTLPFNFGGGPNEAIPAPLPNDPSTGDNANAGSFGSGVNLRGLGSGSTLVLLNGHRLAPSSAAGGFIDISMIPASAIERVEIITDGASSIYGADAVAGVVNFLLRDDFDGAEASLRYGSVTEGNRDEYRASITGGKSWDTGNALLVYEFLSQTNLSAAERSFSQGAILPNDLLPSQRRHSVLASASQELTPRLEIFADVLFSERKAEQRHTLPGFSPTVRIPEARNLNVSVGGAWNVFGDWVADVSGTFSRLEQNVVSTGQVVRDEKVDAEIWTSDVKASGTVFSMPGGDVKLAIGGHYRRETFTRLTTTLPIRDSERDVYAGFGEAFIPIIGPDNARPGAERFEISVSGRVDDYSDFGTTANPKVGVLWSPLKGLNLRGSYSTSFAPPPLGRVDVDDFSVISYPSAFINSILGLTAPDPSIADITIITVNGTDKNLDAEKSRAFTGGFDFDKRQGRNHFNASATYFDIEFEDRLGPTPIPGNRSAFDAPNIAFVSPDAFPPGTVIFFPTQDQVNDLIATADAVFPLFGTDPLDAEVIRFDRLIRNLGLTFVRGLDFRAAYAYEADFGELSFGLDGTYLLDHQQQAAVTSPIVEQVDTRFNPLDLRLRGRAGYSRGGFTANIFVNYADNYRTDNTPDAEPIASWTTIDMTLSYDTEEKFSTPFLDNTVFRLSVRNLFDDNPPAVPSAPSLAIFGFDPTNASPLNRFIAFELTKRF